MFENKHKINDKKSANEIINRHLPKYFQSKESNDNSFSLELMQRFDKQSCFNMKKQNLMDPADCVLKSLQSDDDSVEKIFKKNYNNLERVNP